ncbi:MAG: MBL fold metallo-hydrolase, partial [Hyphomicrobiales bacterium]|nr:MBL fold metallo-hydrolase [Hyphomicrobiales bacterium]
MPRNPYYSGPPSDHFDGARFFLPGGRSTDKSRRDLLRWRFQSRELPAWPSEYPGLPRDKPPPRVHGAALRATFVGHATFLIQTQGVNLLVDPVWSERASPLRFAGPKRVNPPGIDFDDLPPLDAILLTHNHYDHMDMATLKRLAHQRPCPIVTPLGNDTILTKAIAKVDARAYDWGDVVRIGPLAVHLVPAQHWSAR